MNGLSHDVRVAIRSLARARRLTIGAVASLALGIGAVTTVFSFVDAIQFRPLPYLPVRHAARVDPLLALRHS